MSDFSLVSLLGLLGSIAAASLNFPQVWTSFKTKRTRDIAWFSIIIGMFNGAFWTGYGVLKADPFIYVTNTLFFIGAFLLMLLKRKYG